MAIDYRQNDRRTLTPEQAKSWAVAKVEPGGFLSASGKCPACDDETTVEILNEVTTVGAVAGSALPHEARTARKIPCRCNSTHNGRPPEISQGCGRWWLVDVVRSSAGASWTLEPAPGDSMLAAADALEQASKTQLDDVRAAAEKWLPGVAALYGLFGLAGVIAGRDTVKTLPTAGKWLVALAALCGLAASTLATYWGYRAAYGWPITSNVSTNEQLQEWYAAQKARAKTAAENLRLAVLASVVAVIALVVAVGLLWFWPSG